MNSLKSVRILKVKNFQYLSQDIPTNLPELSILPIEEMIEYKVAYSGMQIFYKLFAA